MVITTVNLNTPKEIESVDVKKEKIEDVADDPPKENDKPIKEENNSSKVETPVVEPGGEETVEPQKATEMWNGCSPFQDEPGAPVKEPVLPNPYITLKVKDFLGVFGSTESQLFVVSSYTKIGEFFIDVSSRFNVLLGEFDILYQDKEFSYNLGGLPENQDFAGLNIQPSRIKVYIMSLVANSSKKRKSRPVRESSSDVDLASITLALETTHIQRDFVGLKNRNMTCYLNSFIQGLFFTPEFRNVVYNFMSADGRMNRKSLCLPLQKLFLQLQLSIRDSVDTDELIQSFGWEDRETWNQHDIEELCSVFMDHLTGEFRGTNMEGIIRSLYFGTLDDYVKCLECNRVSQRQDDFLVIPLPIRNFGSPLPNPTLESAFNSFVAYEVLDGNNMYNCSQCEKPCPAHKGLKFNRLPYILSIQLKRFEFDFVKERRLKLNDRVAFPLILDMNAYVETPSPDRRESLKTDLLRPKSMDDGRKQGHSRPNVKLLEQPDDEPGADGAAGGTKDTQKTNSERMKEMVREKGPEIYQLFGVMVHRGGINGGHYYAYIMDFEREKWFRCDDAIVRKASLEDIEGAYGGSFEDDRELTSAYMLLYRRFDPDLNLLPYYLEEMPAHMQQMWKANVDLDKQLQEEEELAKNTLRMTCYMRDMRSLEIMEKVLQIPKTMNVADAAIMISQEFADVLPISDGNSSDCVRLCRFDKDLFIIENSFDGLEEQNILAALRKLPPRTKNECFYVEMKRDGIPFQPYTPDDLVFKTHLVDFRQQEIFPNMEIHASSTSTVDNLKETIIAEMLLGVKVTELSLVICQLGQLNPLIGDKHPLSLFNLSRVNDIYIQTGTEEGLSDSIARFVEQFFRTEIVQLHVQLPLPQDVAAGTAEADQPEKLIALDTPEVPSNSDMNNQNQSDVVNVESADKTVESQCQDAKKCEEALHQQTDALAAVRLQNKIETFIKVIGQTKCEEENVMVYSLRVDGETALYTLSQFVSKLLSTPEEMFVFYKLDKIDSTEMRRLTDRIATIKPFEYLLVKFEQRLQDGQSRIPIYMLNIGSFEKPMEYLTEIVATMKMTLDDVRSMLVEKLNALSCDPKIEKSRLRIRKKLRSIPSKIMKEKMKLQDLFTSYSIQSAELFIQVTDHADLTETNHAIIYRHWHPSTRVLDPPVEVVLYYDYVFELEELLLKSIRESLGFSDGDKIEVAKPDGCCYPWDLAPRLLQDLAWFELPPPFKKSLYVHNDELVLFVRNKDEALVEVDTYQPKNDLKATAGAGAEQPKRETGLRLNLSNSPDGK